ncbi:GDSL esterase/lipase At1g71250-like [Silene latifolia]|uniref:GDSL esterase/lipase At1g71250-like n=1 Tax=Silene latifolia TaxID=37657 RepID=UPI003D78A52F
MNFIISKRALMLLMLHFTCSLAQFPGQQGQSSSPVSGMFAFGDSEIDSGNNNFLSSIAKSNYWPYGIDFGQGPTGRFCNGQTVIDMLGNKLKIPTIPAFADPTAVGLKILSGVNYASAGAGILDETGRHWGARFSLSQQVVNFERTVDQLRNLIGGQNMTRYLQRSVAVMSFGSNDYINNYLLPSIYGSSVNYRPPEFANLLLNHYARQLSALYDLGLRKFFLVGLAPIGCIPNQRGGGQAPPGRCMDAVNQMLGPFNEGLRALAVQLNANHPAAIFVYFNVYGVVGDILNNPASYGFTVVDRACCGLGQVTCLPAATPCPNRNQYVFWDAYHTTEAANAILAQRAFDGPQSDCFPINFHQLALI